MSTRAPVAAARTVRDVMSTRVVTVTPDLSIRQLVQVLAREGISGAPVLDRLGRVVGVVSATDVVRFAAQESELPAGQVLWSTTALPEELEGDDDALSSYHVDPDAAPHFTAPVEGELAESGLDELTVGEIMTPVAFSVRPSDPVEELVQMLLRGRIHRALVVEDGKLLGIVTPFDVLAAEFPRA